MSIAENLERVCAQMRDASRHAGRAPEATTLIAVSKTFSASDIQPLIDAGHRCFGENRVQEAGQKWPELKAACREIELHLIGSLQSNKAADAVALFDVIQSVDRPSLIAALAKAMAQQNRHLPYLLQINIGEEPQKGGCALADVPKLLAQAKNAGLSMIGVMAIPPAGLDPAPFFALLHKIGRSHGLQHCSMGMSGDFETAIQTGSTMVRVGTALFGTR